MIKLKISNPNLSGEEKTFLTSDYSSGTSLSVRNSDSFTVNWFVVVGEPGQERTELKRTTALPTATSITILSALSFSHPKSTPVYRSHYDQVSLERKPSAGSYAEVSGSPFNIGWDNDDNKTFIAVSAGESTDTYRWRFKNSVSAEYTAYSDELAGTGVARTQVGHVINLVRKNPITKNVDDETLLTYASDFQELVYDEVPKAWWFQKKGTAVSTAASDYDYPITSNWSDFLSMKFVLYRYISGDIDETYPLTYSPLNEFYNYKADANQSTDDVAHWWTILPPDSNSADGYIGLHPTPKTDDCYIIPVYQYEISALDSFGDTLVIPYQKGYVDYILYRIFDDIKNDPDKANIYNTRVARDINALKKRARRQLGQPELFRWRGQRGWSKMYGDNAKADWQLSKENYF